MVRILKELGPIALCFSLSLAMYVGTILLVLFTQGCGGGDDTSVITRIDNRQCYMGDLVVTVGSDGNVVSTRPIEETEVFEEVSDEEGAARVMLRTIDWLKGEPVYIVPCSDLGISSESDNDTTIVSPSVDINLAGTVEE